MSINRSDLDDDNDYDYNYDYSNYYYTTHIPRASLALCNANSQSCFSAGVAACNVHCIRELLPSAAAVPLSYTHIITYNLMSLQDTHTTYNEDETLQQKRFIH